MKKYIKIIAVLSVFTLVLIAFSACSGLSEHELAASGKYNLTVISGTNSVGASDYDYNYITLKTDGSFVIENKSQDITYSSSGKWSLDGETLILKLSGLFTKKEKHTLSGNKILLNGILDDAAVTMEYTLE